MTTKRRLAMVAVALTAAACGSKDTLLHSSDGAIDQPGAGAGGAWSGGGGTGALGGAGGATIHGTGGVGNGGSPSGTGGATGGSGDGGKTTLVSGTGGGIGDGGGPGTGGRGTGGRMGSGGTAAGGTRGLDGGGDGPLATCGEVTTQTECDLRDDCHSVFVDPGTCGCATPGCCARFSSCADGNQAACSGVVACPMAMPHCESPYAVSLKGSCFEGCVKESDCLPVPCPDAPPLNASYCELSQTCYYENCAGSGRTVATCTANLWKVTTGACATIACEANPDSPSGLVCPAGKVCILNSSTGGAPITTPTCVEHTCGTGPIGPQCVQSLNGTCTATYSIAGAIFRCQAQLICGDAGCA